MKTKDVYADPAKDIKKKSEILNYEVERPLPINKNSKVNERWIRGKNKERGCIKTKYA